jgi:xylulokinase
VSEAKMSKGMEYYIGIDIGTTHIKSALFHDQGVMLEVARDKTPVTKDTYGQIYDPVVIFGIVKKQLSVWFKKYDHIQGISITGMSEAGLIVNKVNGIEATPIIPWFDQRTAGLAERISKEEETSIFCTTGLRNSFKYGIYKYLWLLEHSDINKEDTIWLSICDYIGWKLTGHFVTDSTFAARTYVYNIVTCGWDMKRLKESGLSEENFPTVLPSGEKAGYLTEPELCQLSGNSSVTVSIGGHDHVCAAYAVLNKDNHRICNSVGTAETYLGVEERFTLTKDRFDSGMVYGPFLNKNKYFWMANISSSGQSISWFCNNLQINEISYEKMNEMVGALPEGPTDIIYYPYLSGIGTPLFRSDIGGAILGLRKEHGTADIIKAIMEGINYQGKWIISLVPEMDTAGIKEVLCVGGAADSAPWMQIKANILGLPVSVPRIKEATLLGAVAVMIEMNQGELKKDRFLEESQKQAGNYPVSPDINMQYDEVYENKYAYLIDLFLKQELGRKE